jgi:hypothetical protein
MIRQCALSIICLAVLTYPCKIVADEAGEAAQENDYYAKKKISGIVFTAAGGATFIVGATLFVVNIPHMHGYETGSSAGVLWDTPDGLVGSILGLTGAVCTIIGVVKWTRGASALHYYGRELKAPDRGFRFELQPNGARLAYSF